MKRIFIQQIWKSVSECILIDPSKNYIHESYYKPTLKIFTQVDQEWLLHYIYLSWSSCNVLFGGVLYYLIFQCNHVLYKLHENAIKYLSFQSFI